ncbi:phenylacetic acid degradation protein [Endozoicomonas sp. OPT23]|uniref:2Fe-2S iron-sulfur cluster-binding protein n=1 Tax=Endozoicomonas sp. OPT23 TaxID=2072845 RepID=UPI00129A2E86|nr:2Fe-2S iron-sulfur cluster-binding protein [Endozoicomonas sp. OPT23]MRI33615.1 phenylacetic acid degradation protein [Endozoicomonas sp. OPT23]
MDTQFYPLSIASVQPETETAVSVIFEVPEHLKERFRFTPGQFLTLRTAIDHKEVRRSYSICSEAGGSLRVAIKRIRGGLFSNHANDHFKPGMVVDVMPPQGSFSVATCPEHRKSYMFLAVGSGITPILSNIRTVLTAEPNSDVTLVYGNKSTHGSMFREELSFLKNAYLNRFKWINIMSQEDQGTDLLNGRIDNKKGYQLQKMKLIDIRNTDEAFICGPESMMSEVSRGFRLEGLGKEQIHYELFAISAEDAQERLRKAQQRIHEYGEEKTSKVTVRADGRAISFDLATVGENILDAGINKGMELPYACKAGVCSTCKCKLVKGQVDMDISHGLELHEVEAGFVLSCQAHPVSDEVELDFDQR